MSMHTQTHTIIHTHTHTHAYTYRHAYTRVKYIHTIYTRALYLYMHTLYLYTHIQIHTLYIHACTDTHIHTHTKTHTHTQTHVYTNTHVYTQKHIHTRYIYTNTYAYTRIKYIHMHIIYAHIIAIHTDTHAHTCTNTQYIYTHMQSMRSQRVGHDWAANLGNSAVATGLEKVSFHSNPKERQCQRMLKLPHTCTHLTRE